MKSDDVAPQGDLSSTISSRPFLCPYCGSNRLSKQYENLYHKRKRDFGPFDLYLCMRCGSAITLPPPSVEGLAALYQMMVHGLAASTRSLLAENPEAAWHRMCIDHMARFAGLEPSASFRWIDIGAGAGEMAAAMAHRFPHARGTAIDIHERPPALADSHNVDWMHIGVADENFAVDQNLKADLVFAVGVWEHIRYPDIFVRNAIRLLKPYGMLYMFAPNYGSLARRILGKRWPYFLPGEHIGIPSVTGARRSLERELAHVHGPQMPVRILVRPILVTYSVRYALAKFGFLRVAKLVPPSVAFKMPSGALEAALWLEAHSSSSKPA
jgi:SAM-dependent methyltransferase